MYAHGRITLCIPYVYPMYTHVQYTHGRITLCIPYVSSNSSSSRITPCIPIQNYPMYTLCIPMYRTPMAELPYVYPMFPNSSSSSVPMYTDAELPYVYHMYAHVYLCRINMYLCIITLCIRYVSPCIPMHKYHMYTLCILKQLLKQKYLPLHPTPPPHPYPPPCVRYLDNDGRG